MARGDFNFVAPGGEFSVEEQPDGSIVVLTPYGAETVVGAHVDDSRMQVKLLITATVLRQVAEHHEEHSEECDHRA